LDSPGLLIAKAVVILYLTIGPIILFAIYSFFDGLIQDDPDKIKMFKGKPQKDPVLWSDADVDDYLRENKAN